jgi:hypothetical protein
MYELLARRQSECIIANTVRERFSSCGVNLTNLRRGKIFKPRTADKLFIRKQRRTKLLAPTSPLCRLTRVTLIWSSPQKSAAETDS